MTFLSRRETLFGAAGGLAALASPAFAATANSGPTLASIAKSRELLFGASIADDIFRDDAYRALYVKETSIVTTDYALKFSAVRARPAIADYSGGDALVDFARANGLQVRGHTLIWNDDMPAWVKGLSRREVEALFDKHIDETVSRYAGRLHSWDVVNEPFWPDHRAPRNYRRGPWYDALGPSYVPQALRRARRLDPAAKITLNEAFCERNDAFGKTVRGSFIALIDELRDQDAPLDAVGFQGHLKPQYDYSDEAFAEFLHRVAQRKLDIYITELDVDDSSFANDPATRDRQVAERYASFLRHVLAVPEVKIVITWQLADKFSGMRDPALPNRGRPARPLPFDDDLARKPAWRAIADAFAARAI
ncbi:endo-1,4-beta-xylanase [Terrarubrum flagellatum]|uniref:endo-1,4-beta-xylanase n=1 Tax=Terrirubrum flagellatum TaxID=2895980 RepID=UPI00314529A8